MSTLSVLLKNSHICMWIYMNLQAIYENTDRSSLSVCLSVCVCVAFRPCVASAGRARAFRNLSAGSKRSTNWMNWGVFRSLTTFFLYSRNTWSAGTRAVSWARWHLWPNRQGVRLCPWTSDFESCIHQMQISGKIFLFETVHVHS